MGKELITIIIPIYNVEKYIHKCIDSIINQTYKNLEIILVDDGSPDNCGKICDEYAKKDRRIKVIHKENGGISDARNFALDIFKGEYVAFLDSDDYVSTDYIEYMYTLLRNNDSTMSICGVQVVNNSNKKYNQYETIKTKIYNKEQAFENLLYSEGIEVSVNAKLYPREFWNETRFPIGEKYEDIAVIAEIINKAEKIAFGNKKCYYYLTRQGSISRNGFNKGELDYIKNVKKMLECIEKNTTGIEDAILRYNIYSKFRTLRILLFSKVKDNKLQEQLIMEIKKDCKLVYKNSRTPKRDKLAIILLKLGLPIFKISWYLYSKLTGRVL